MIGQSPLQALGGMGVMGPWYVATPYTHFPAGLDEAADFAAEQAALLLKAGHEVFSPIVHSHWVATAAGEDAFDLTDGDFWLARDLPFMQASRGMVFVEGPSWERSSGMLRELVWFTKQRKPVVFMTPGVVPTLPGQWNQSAGGLGQLGLQHAAQVALPHHVDPGGVVQIGHVNGGAAVAEGNAQWVRQGEHFRHVGGGSW